MINETQPEFTDEAFAALERETAARFLQLLAEVPADEAASAARQARILQRAQGSSDRGGDPSGRIDRILIRIQEERTAAAATSEARARSPKEPAPEKN